MIKTKKWPFTNFALFFLALMNIGFIYYFTFQPKTSKNFSWPKIYILGDSLTQRAFTFEGCWGSIIADAFQRRADFIARGFSGYNTRQCRDLLPYLKDDLKDVTIAGIFLGANDANDIKINPLGVSLKEYKENLVNMTNFMKDNGIKSIFLITPPALDDVVWQKICQSNAIFCSKTSKLVSEYASVCTETAKELGLPYVDLHSSMLKQNNWKRFLSDGLHFSNEGSKFVGSQILAKLQTLWNEVNSLKGAKEIMPPYSHISVTRPDVSFMDWIREYQ